MTLNLIGTSDRFRRGRVTMVYDPTTFRAIHHKVGFVSGIRVCKLGRKLQQQGAKRSALVVFGSPSTIAHTPAGRTPGLQC